MTIEPRINPFLARGTKEGKKTRAYKRAPKQEKESATRLGGWLTPASGAKDKKGDVQVKDVARIECKATSLKSFSVTREMIEKIEAAGIGSGEIPFIEIEFLAKNGKPSHKVAVIPLRELEILLNRARNADFEAGSQEAAPVPQGPTLKRGKRRT